MRDNGRKAASLMVQILRVACRQPLGTILSLPVAIYRHRLQHLRLPCPPRSLSRTVAAHLGLPSGVDPARTMAVVQTGQNVAFGSSSQPPWSRRCDDHLNPPCKPRSVPDPEVDRPHIVPPAG